MSLIQYGFLAEAQHTDSTYGKQAHLCFPSEEVVILSPPRNFQALNALSARKFPSITSRKLTPMNEQKRDSSRHLALLMNEVHVQLSKSIYLDDSLEMRMLIEFGFLLLPIEALLPVGC